MFKKEEGKGEMKHYAFILTIPGRNTWNGKWTGDSRFYAKVKSFRNEQLYFAKFKDGDNFGYCWDDGWCANVEIKQVTSKEKQQILKNSNGFCGYEWMISSIIKHGEIRKPK